MSLPTWPKFCLTSQYLPKSLQSGECLNPRQSNSSSPPMWKFPTFLNQKWLPKTWEIFISIISAIVFIFLDFLEVIMCVFYRLVDEIVEGKGSSCYCFEKEREEENKNIVNIEVDHENEMSESHYNRKNIFRKLGLLNFLGIKLFSKKRSGGGAFVMREQRRSRWSDCGCDSCCEWISNGDDLKLHVVVNQPQKVFEDCKRTASENVIFLHGFMASSSFFAKTVFPNLSESIKQNYQLFAVDLLGFGKSPKPQECLYTMRDHLDMIEKSVIRPFQLESFHLVAHSMGCVIALAIAAKYSKSVKSVTLVAPPYFPSEENASLTALERLAARRIWPPMLFGSSFMSWYEHLGRCVCYILCRHHQTWERILKLLTGQRILHYTITDLTKHTHHSAWHTMHNVICGGVKLMDGYLEVLDKERVKIYVVHGTKDQVVPLECSRNIKKKVTNVDVSIIENADHSTVILGREVKFSRGLEHAWRGT